MHLRTKESGSTLTLQVFGIAGADFTKRIGEWCVTASESWSGAKELEMTDSEKLEAIGRLQGMTLDVHDLELTKKFWLAVLGTKIVFESDYWVGFAPQAGLSGLDLQRVSEEKIVKNRAHLDIVLTDYEVGVKRLEALGAKVTQQVSSKERRWSIILDPEGNEFCAIETISA